MCTSDTRRDVSDTFGITSFNARDVITSTREACVKHMQDRLVATRIVLKRPVEEMRLDHVLTELERNDWFVFRQMHENAVPSAIITQAIRGSSSRVTGRTETNVAYIDQLRKRNSKSGYENRVIDTDLLDDKETDVELSERQWLLPSCVDPSRVVSGRWLFDLVAMPHRARYIQAYIQRCYLGRVYELRAALYEMVSSGVFEMAYPRNSRDGRVFDAKERETKCTEPGKSGQKVDVGKDLGLLSYSWCLPRAFLVGADRIAPRHHVRRPHSHYHLMSPGDYKRHTNVHVTHAASEYEALFELTADPETVRETCSTQSPLKSDTVYAFGKTERLSDDVSSLSDSNSNKNSKSSSTEDTDVSVNDETNGSRKSAGSGKSHGIDKPDAVAVPGMYPKQFRLSISSPCCSGHVHMPESIPFDGSSDAVSNPDGVKERWSRSKSYSCAVYLHHPIQISALYETPEGHKEEEEGENTVPVSDDEALASFGNANVFSSSGNANVFLGSGNTSVFFGSGNERDCIKTVMGPLVTTRRDLPVLACITMPTINSFLNPTTSIVEPLVIPTLAVIDDYDRHVAHLFQTRRGLAKHPCRDHLISLVSDRKRQKDTSRTVRQRLPLSGLLIDIDIGMCRRLLAAHRHARRRDRQRARAGQAHDRLLFWCLYCPAINIMRFGCTRVDGMWDPCVAPSLSTVFAGILPVDVCDVDRQKENGDKNQAHVRCNTTNAMYTFCDPHTRIADVPPLVPIPQLGIHSLLR
jgi:hypothetical protein